MNEQAEHETGQTTEAWKDESLPSPLPSWVNWVGLLGVVLVTLTAGIGRLLALDQYPGGMADAEAQHGLLARQSGDFGLQWAIENAGALSIPLVIVTSWIGGLTGYEIDTPRIAAALFGTASILVTGLWLRRAMGPLWGMAGAAILAGSFWHILFSRLAIGQIAGAFALAALCWFLAEAADRRGSRAMPWYVLAGLAAGIGFLSTPALRLLPLVLVGALIISLLRLRERPEQSEARNWLFAAATAYLTISPYLIANRDQLQDWTPWTTTPGLPGNDAVDLATMPGALIDSVLALFLASDVERGLNLPPDPWFSLLMLPWALIGLLGVISASNRPELRDHFLVGAGVGVAALLGISAIDAGHPGQLIVISPALAGITVYGFRTAINWARVRTIRIALTGLVVIGIAGEAVVSYQQYVEEWTLEPETQAMFHVDVTNALIAAEALETNESIFISAEGHGTVLDYFRTTARRHSFDGSNVLPFPADENGYLLEPITEPLAGELAELLEDTGSDTPELDDSAYQGYRLDARIRGQMPLSAPTVRYPDGPVLHGNSHPSRPDEETVRFLIAWQSEPERPPFTVETRFRATEPPHDETSATTTLPANPLQSRLVQVLVIELEIPDTAGLGELEVRLRREDGAIIPVSGMDEDGFLLLNRYEISE